MHVVIYIYSVVLSQQTCYKPKSYHKLQKNKNLFLNRAHKKVLVFYISKKLRNIPGVSSQHSRTVSSKQWQKHSLCGAKFTVEDCCHRHDRGATSSNHCIRLPKRPWPINTKVSYIICLNFVIIVLKVIILYLRIFRRAVDLCFALINHNNIRGTMRELLSFLARYFPCDCLSDVSS